MDEGRLNQIRKRIVRSRALSDESRRVTRQTQIFLANARERVERCREDARQFRHSLRRWLDPEN